MQELKKIPKAFIFRNKFIVRACRKNGKFEGFITGRSLSEIDIKARVRRLSLYGLPFFERTTIKNVDGNYNKAKRD